MKTRYTWIIAVLLMITLLPSRPVAAETGSQRPAPGLVERLNDAGPNARHVWQSFTKAEQRTVLDYLQPEFHRRGQRGDLMAVVFVPVPTDDLMYARAYAVRNVTQCCTYMPRATYVSGNAPATGSATLGLSIQDTVSNSWSANVGVSASVVSAGVGFSVTSSRTVQYSYSITMPPNTRWQIDAYNQFKHYDYEVWSGTTRVGNGYARKFVGVYYYAFQV